jgi:AbrB family looped-hinge helix DNA binding protein
MKEIASTITSKGQVTIPVEVRRHLGLHQGDRISFVIDDEGHVELKTPKYPTIASLAGAAGTLKDPRTMEEMLEIARGEALSDEYQRGT